jgi:cytochrome c oxidase cbb3-type subunit 3
MKPLLLAISVALLLSGCYREERPLPTSPPGASPPAPLRISSVQPGESLPGASTSNPLEENAYATSQGKRLFKQFNCNGCHGGAGGGDSGPPLMDDKWIYGHDPANIFASIMQGRPNGMPSFGGHIPEEQAWQIVAYIRSMSGQLRPDVAPSRSDSLSAGKPEQRHEKETPKPVSQPQSDR